MHSWGAAGRRGSVAALIVGFAVTACSTGGTVTGPPGPTGSESTSATGRPASPTPPTGAPDSPTSATPRPDVTVTPDEAAAAVKAYQSSYNAAEAALDTGRMTKAESGSLLATDQVNIIYVTGLGGDKETQLKQPISLTDPLYFIPHTAAYPRGFFATANVVQSGAANASWLIHLTQAVPGGPWLADSAAILGSGQQWPAFAVGADGLLDDSAVRQDQLALSAVDLAAADRTMLADGNAGQPGTPFLNDDVTAMEQRWVQAESDGVPGANVAETVTTDLSPAPMAMPLKDGGELVLYGTRISLRISQTGHTFNFTDQGFAKVAGTDHFEDGFTADSIYLAAAIDPPDKAAKIQKIAQSGGLVALR